MMGGFFVFLFFKPSLNGAPLESRSKSPRAKIMNPTFKNSRRHLVLDRLGLHLQTLSKLIYSEIFIRKQCSVPLKDQFAVTQYENTTTRK